jgi:hypothetical protein
MQLSLHSPSKAKLQRHYREDVQQTTDRTIVGMPIQSELLGRAKARIANWFDASGEPIGLRTKLLAGMDLIAREIPHRADWFEVMTVKLDESKQFTVSAIASDHQYRMFPSKTGLVVSTIVPGWNFGWSKILTDSEVRDILTWFLHNARQYVHRSHVAATLMMIWDEQKVVLHPFGSGAMYQRYGPVIPFSNNIAVLEVARQESLEQWGKPNDEVRAISSPWLTRNILDPYIHQAVFHYLRAQNLLAKDFATEAIVAFDCAIQSIGTFLRRRQKLPRALSRSEICDRFGLSAESAATAEHAYFVRNNFGAHAGGWRWWDQHELFEDGQLDETAEVTEAILSRAADEEPTMRAVDPNPVDWPTWLFENFDMLWDAVWFDKLVHDR